ncbi:MAG: anti-sigma factor antagonist [Clostridia bacterium]|nr:anti-sigma factor antagonist [Clostridia bacterium]
MSVVFERKGNTLIARLSGEIDHHSAAEFRESIDREAELLRPELLLLDFGEIGFMDSSGIGLIMGRYKNAAAYGGTVRVINAPPMIERMMKLAGMSRLDVI